MGMDKNQLLTIQEPQLTLPPKAQWLTTINALSVRLNVFMRKHQCLKREMVEAM